MITIIKNVNIKQKYKYYYYHILLENKKNLYFLLQYHWKFSKIILMAVLISSFLNIKRFQVFFFFFFFILYYLYIKLNNGQKSTTKWPFSL